MADSSEQTRTNTENIEFPENGDYPFDTADFTAVEVMAIVRLSEVPSKFKTQTELCQSLGIGRTTLWEWQQKPKFKAALTKMALFMLKNTGYIAYTGLLKSCAKGNPQALKLYFQYAEGWVEKSKLEHEGGVALPTSVSVQLADGTEVAKLGGLTKEDETEKKPNPTAEATQAKAADKAKK